MRDKRHYRISGGTIAALALLAFPLACSTGLGTETPCGATPVGSKSGNVTTGLFFGFDLMSPAGGRAAIDEQALAGAIIPGTSTVLNRRVAFYAFTTDASADDAGTPGANRFLDRDGIADRNGVGDVFVAAVVEQKIDTTAFSYSLAGKFRHPRCVNCHSVSKEPGFSPAPLSTVFEFSNHPTVEGVQAPQPGSGKFQNTTENGCLTCHEAVLAATPVQGAALGDGWRNPATSIGADFRLLGIPALAQAARGAPTSHFQQDRRVNWALNNATLPSRSVINGPFTAADDDNDGVIEAFDSDGRRRAVPGGGPNFLAEMDAFLCSAAPNDTRDALADVSLASRAMGQAPNAASSQPDVAFVANSGFDPAAGGIAGELFVAYSSSATDIDPLSVGGIQQVYRATFDVVVGTPGNVNLRYTGVRLVSSDAAGTLSGDGDSHSPSISSLPSTTMGTDAGARIAFVSDASNLGPVGAPGAVYVRDLDADLIVRASGVMGQCDSTSIDPTGRIVAFVSPEVPGTLGVTDTNGVDDVYFSRIIVTSGLLELEDEFPQRASITNGMPGETETLPSESPDVILDGDETILVAFHTENVLDARGDGSAPGSNVFVHSFTGVPSSPPVAAETFQVSLTRSIVGTLELPDGPSSRACFPGRSDRLVFETDATNLDTAFLMPPDPDFGIFTFKSGDENSEADIVMATLPGILNGSATSRIVGLSVSPAGAFGDRGTVAPVAASLVSGLDSGRVVVGGLTFARNLGAADNHIGLTMAERTSWLSFVVDAAPEPLTEFGRVSSILRSRCMPCHAPAGSNSGNFSLGNDDAQLHATLTSMSSTCAPSTPYVDVVGFDPNASLIVQLMEGPACGIAQMPDGVTEVPQVLIDVVREWILNGAQSN